MFKRSYATLLYMILANLNICAELWSLKVKVLAVFPFTCSSRYVVREVGQDRRSFGGNDGGMELH